MPYAQIQSVGLSATCTDIRSAANLSTLKRSDHHPSPSLELPPYLPAARPHTGGDVAISMPRLVGSQRCRALLLRLRLRDEDEEARMMRRDAKPRDGGYNNMQGADWRRADGDRVGDWPERALALAPRLGAAALSSSTSVAIDSTARPPVRRINDATCAHSAAPRPCSGC